MSHKTGSKTMVFGTLSYKKNKLLQQKFDKVIIALSLFPHVKHSHSLIKGLHSTQLFS